LDGAALDEVATGLRENGLLGFSHVLTGYVGNATFLRSIAAVVREVRAVHPGAVYVCDPVLGDHGRLYVPPELVPVYREEIVPLATVLTPNQFEAEQLTGLTITDAASAAAAADALHAMGVRTVIITSTDLPAGQSDVMWMLASTPWGERAVAWAARRRDEDTATSFQRQH
jgi:pyridoxine kinase